MFTDSETAAAARPPAGFTAAAARPPAGFTAAPVRPPAGFTAAAVAAACLAVAHAGPGVTALAPVRRRFFPRLAGQGRDDHVALTFDDGPDPAWTPAFLEVLATWRARATFFMLGSMAVQAPGLAAMEPSMKKVARARQVARTSRNAGVHAGSGPSSKVSAT